MDSRFEEIYRAPQNIYCEGSPIVFNNGRILHDLISNRVIGQIKFQNISSKVISSAEITFIAIDDNQSKVNEISSFQYKDLNLIPGTSTGSKIPVPLDVTAKKILYTCSTVFFDDGSFWKMPVDSSWTPLKEQHTLEEYFGGGKYADEYWRMTDCKGNLLPYQGEGIWVCTCGTINGQNDECFSCRIRKEMLFSFLDKDSIVEKVNKKEEEAKLSAEKNKKRFRRIAKICFCGVVVIAGIILTAKVIIPSISYQKAKKLIENNQYSKAVAIYEKLDGYKDSDNLILPTKYKEAEYLFSELRYEDAKKIFKELNNYKDSKNRIIDCDYQMAMELLKDQKFQEAYTIFNDIKSSKDVDEEINDCYEGLYQTALLLWDEKKYDESNAIFSKILDYKDSSEKIHEHIYNTFITREPTCSETGVALKTCECGKTIEEIIPAKGHEFFNKVTQNPTCTETGLAENICKVCGYTESGVVVPAKGHSFVSQVKNAPTCIKDGTSENVCQICGYTEDGGTIPATGHNYIEKITTEPTCIEDGIKTFTCSACGDSYTETVFAIGHSWVNATCKQAKHCSICGLEEGTAKEHTWGSDCKCSVCGTKHDSATLIFEGSTYLEYGSGAYAGRYIIESVTFSDRYYNGKFIKDMRITWGQEGNRVDFGGYNRGSYRIKDSSGKIIMSKENCFSPSLYANSSNNTELECIDFDEEGTFYVEIY